ncbi:signal peptide prediction [Ideonella sp. A 288]|uniref:signal peptide prediction n=1 Tax=Ideonella sp. A 288 TaxID=1962181 RepID=UPI001F1FFC7D|nr:signal peptide prediction [Ideonella sp. A 288]
MKRRAAASPGRVPLSPARIARLAWAAPTTLIGLLAAVPMWGLGARGRLVDGVLELSARRPGAALRALARHLPFEAITLGHVVLAVDARAMRRWRMHERVHVRQAERWGPLFVPLYLGASALCWLRGRDAYRDNPFEREAFAVEDRRSIRES